MFCTGCEEERAQKDFMLDHDKCYRCIYREKLKQCGGARRRCKICKIIIVGYRAAYCSNKCAKVGLEKDRITRYKDRMKLELIKDQEKNAHKYTKKCVSS